MKILTYAVWSVSIIFFLFLSAFTAIYVIAGAPEIGKAWPAVMQSWVACLSMVAISTALWWYREK